MVIMQQMMQLQAAQQTQQLQHLRQVIQTLQCGCYLQLWEWQESHLLLQRKEA